MRFPDDMERIDGASSCEGKQPYSEKSAHKAAIRMNFKKNEPFEAYKCRHCEHWHVGHPRFWKWDEREIEAVTEVVIVIERET